jgi:signal transduction histidine kinase
MRILLFCLIVNVSFCQQFQEEIEIKSLYTAKPSAFIFNEIAKKLNYLNLLDSSHHASKRAIELAIKEKNKEELSKGHLNSAIIYQKKARYFEANDCYENAHKFCVNDSIKAQVYHLWATCYKDQNLLEKSDEYLKKSLEIAKNNDFKTIWAWCLNSKGLTIFRNENYYDKALATFHEALEIVNQTDDDYIKSAINKNIGWVHLLWKEEKEGLSYVNKAIEIQTKSNKSEVRQGLFYSYMVLIQFYHLVKKDYKLSNFYCQKAIAIAEKYGWIEEQAEVCEYFFKNYVALHESEEALKYHKKYQQFVNQINEDKIRTQMAIYDERATITNLAIENKQKENQRNWLIFSLLIVIFGSLIIYWLYRLNRKQKIRIEEINQNLEQKVEARTTELQNAYNEIKDAMMRGQTLERKRVAADLHDNLGSLLSAIGVSTETMDETKMSESEKKIFGNIKSQITDAYQEVRLLSHNLQPAELEKEGLHNALEVLAQKINSLNKIHLQLDLETLTPKSQNIEFNLYSICLEAINNILKHSKATKAKISFQYSPSGVGGLVMRIFDNGIGFENKSKNGSGIKNIQSRVEQLGGELKINSDKKGTVLEVWIG